MITSQTDHDLGVKTIAHALGLLAWGVSLAVAWSCSSIMMAIVMFIVTALVMALLNIVVFITLSRTVSDETVESIGHTVGAASARIKGFFTRKAVA